MRHAAARGLTQEECLVEYARFTSEHGEAALAGDRVPDVQARLYRNAYHLGRMPGRLLRVDATDDVMALGRFLYGILDIDFQGSSTGDITIRRCYFSDQYSPGVCRLMSAMDRGLLAGLAGGGELAFSERITEGAACCRARFEMRPAMNYQEQTV